MKRYLLLAGQFYYPNRMDDFVNTFDTFEEAEEVGKILISDLIHFLYREEWYQIFDLVEKKIVKDSKYD